MIESLLETGLKDIIIQHPYPLSLSPKPLYS
jgi:hypothetical protein